MSVLSIEKLARKNSHEHGVLTTAAIALKDIVTPPEHLDIPSLDNIPLKAVTEIDQIENPFTKLHRAAELHDSLDDQVASAEIDTLIDTLSHDLLEHMSDYERRIHLPPNHPDHVKSPGNVVALTQYQILDTFAAYDAHPTEETRKLVEFAAIHPTEKEWQDDFKKILALADREGLTLMSAFDKVIRREDSHNYDWVFNENASRP